MRTALLLLVVLATTLGAARRPPTPFDLRAAVGKPIPALMLAFPDGTTLDTRTLRGRPTYVVLIASWCEPCKRNLRNVRADYARFGDRVRFIGVDVYDDREAALAYLALERLPFPVAVFTLAELDAVVPLDVREASGTHYDVPGDVLIDGSGIVRASWYGVIDAPDGNPVDDLPRHLAEIGIR